MKYTIQLSDIKRDVEDFFKIETLGVESKKGDLPMQRYL